ncbi:MAG: hypothetical protein ACLFU0_06470 [Alphaproteobacteria bacterium]
MTAQVREAVGVFHSLEDVERAAGDLMTSGFGRADLSVLASESAVREKLAHVVQSVRELEGHPEVPTKAYAAREDYADAEGAIIGGLLYMGALTGMLPVLASGGAIASAMLTTPAAGATGASFASVLAESLGRHHAHALAEHLEKGGILLCVRVRDEPHEQRATEILERHGGDDVHVHDLPDRPAVLKERYQQRAAIGEEGAVHEFYAGEDLIHMPDGHCYAAGRLFVSAAEARHFLDGFSKQV